MNRWLTWALAVLVGLAANGEAVCNSISGDLRYRHEMIDREGNDARNRHRIRARFGIQGEVNDHLSLVVRLASGSADPISTNETLDGAFSSKAITLDRAYFNWHTSTAGGSKFHILGGKVGNPYFAPGKNQLIWDGDLNPEGLAAKMSTSSEAPVSVFLHAGTFWVDERSSDDDSMLLGAQAGLTNKRFTAGVSLFTCSEVKGRTPFFDPDDSFGNSTVLVDPDGTPDTGDESITYAHDFRQIEAFIELSLPAGPVPVTVFGDFVQNTDPEENNTAYLGGIKLGAARKAGEWEAVYNYRRVEKDALLGVFCDSDFIGGGTDGKGHQLCLAMAAGENTSFGVTYFLNQAGLDNGMDYKRLQVDFVSSFK